MPPALNTIGQQPIAMEARLSIFVDTNCRDDDVILSLLHFDHWVPTHVCLINVDLTSTPYWSGEDWQAGEIWLPIAPLPFDGNELRLKLPVRGIAGGTPCELVLRKGEGNIFSLFLPWPFLPLPTKEKQEPCGSGESDVISPPRRSFSVRNHPESMLAVGVVLGGIVTAYVLQSDRWNPPSPAPSSVPSPFSPISPKTPASVPVDAQNPVPKPPSVAVPPPATPLPPKVAALPPKTESAKTPVVNRHDNTKPSPPVSVAAPPAMEAPLENASMQVPSCPPPSALATAVQVEGCSYQGQVFVNQSFGHTRFIKVKFASVTFGRGTDLSQATFQSCDFTSAKFIGANLTNFKASDSVFTSAVFPPGGENKIVNCNLLNADFKRTDLTNVHFSGCRFDGARLDGAILRGTSFRSTSLKFSVFDDAVLQDNDWAYAKIDHASFNIKDFNRDAIKRVDGYETVEPAEQPGYATMIATEPVQGGKRLFNDIGSTLQKGGRDLVRIFTD